MKKYTLSVVAFAFIIGVFGFNINSLNAASNSSVVEITKTYSSINPLGQYVDATQVVKDGVKKLTQKGGGILFFHPGQYFVKETIELPSNITIECVGSGEVGPCMIILGSDVNINGKGMALFSIMAGANNVKIRDVELRSMTPGRLVYPRTDLGRIKSEGTIAIDIGRGRSTKPTKDIQLENIRIVNFTYGINAGPSKGNNDPVVENVKLRTISSFVNHFALRVNSLKASGWDIQNLDVVEMDQNQNGILIERTGKMAFLQLSCASTGHNADTCIKIGKRSGPLYFRQVHVEGPRQGLLVSDTSNEPLYFDNSAISGVVQKKNNIYLFSNASWMEEEHRIRFTGDGALSKVYGCANVFTNGHPTTTQIGLPYRGLVEQPVGCNFDVTKVNNLFGTGALPFELSNLILSSSNPDTKAFNVKSFGAKGDGVTDDTAAIRRALENNPWSRSLIFFPSGRYRVSDTLNLDMATILQGEAGTVIEFTAVNRPLFKVRVMNSDPVLKRSLHIKNMALRSTRLNAEIYNTTAIEFSGDNGATTDHSFNQLEISGFTRGIYVRNDTGIFNTEQPMVDSVAVRDLKLINNYRGIEIRSQNASNWNFENVSATRMQPGQIGVVINGPGHITFRGLYCEGQSGVGASGVNDRRAEACISVVRHNAGLHIDGLKAKNVKYAFHAPWEIGWTPFPTVIRNSDLTEGVYIAGTLFLLSVSNTYATPSYASDSGVTQLGSRSVYFNVQGSDNPSNFYPGDASRVTSCGDRFINPNTQQAGTLQFVGLRLAPELCTSSTVTPPPAPTSGNLSITPASKKIKVGEKATFQARYQGPTSANSSSSTTSSLKMSDLYTVHATWTSSDENVATVTYKDTCPTGANCLVYQPDYKTAEVTAIGVGTATITASYKDANVPTSASVSATAKVTVSKVDKIPIETSAGEQVLGAESFHFTLLLKKGSSGEQVTELQKFLNMVLGASGVNYNLKTDGKFGAMTESAVIKFQAVNGLTADGIVGPATREVLNR